ncbi:hypothetical protein K435DRAFT_616960, partial [Dendrothele bispora CBS 962.96]
PPTQYFTDRIILAARNNDVDDINNQILGRMPGQAITCYSVDSVDIERGADDPSLADAIPVEHLKSLGE